MVVCILYFQYFQLTETGLFKFYCNEKKKTCQFIDKFLTYGVY